MSFNIAFLRYNNYFNRIVRVEENENDYLEHPYTLFFNINFNPRDGVNANLVLNTEFNGDYLLVIDPITGHISSRWFVTESKYERNMQRTLSLRRDVVADYYQQVVAAPCFIEKATLTQDDPMIFNSEGMQFNRIKKSETELKDEFGCGWIVGYTQIPSDGLKSDSIDFTGSSNYISVSSLLDWDFYDYCTTSSNPPNDYYITLPSNSLNKILVRIANERDTLKRYVSVDFDGNQTILKEPTTIYQKAYVVNFNDIPDFTSLKTLVTTQSFRNTLCSTLGYQFDSEDFNGLVDKGLIRDASTGKFYKIHIKTYATEQYEDVEINQSAGSLYTMVKSATEATVDRTVGSDETPFRFRSKVNLKYIYLEETIDLSGDLNISDNAVFLKKANDSDYAIFAIPCPKKNSRVNAFNYDYTFDKSMAMAQLLMRQLQPASSGGHLIDIQLLPYCPIVGIFDTSLEQLDFKDSNGVVVGKAYALRKSSFQFVIPHVIEVNDLKIANECDTWRIVSPNFASSYEFSAAKNYGVEGFHVNCTYKPFSPFIDIHPIYKGLYGEDFDDNRGLILGGDFSLPQTGEAWRTYQIQNKNYSNIFDRQMQNLDKQNAWGIANSIGGALAGTVQGGAMGALMGPAGAVAGAATSAIGGALDVTQTVMMMAENKDMQKDMYGYQLGNIDSRPNSLVKSSPFDINNKFFPVLEFITCTDVERKALESKIRYNGMTVMRIGAIQDFLPQSSFIKGQLIRLEDLPEDSHLVSEIYNEIAKGVYF